MAKQRCRNCNVEVNADVIEAGTFYNVYHCPNCHRKFGRPTALKTGLKVAKFMVVGALVLGGVIDADDVADATDA